MELVSLVMWENCTFDCEIFRCDKVYYCNSVGPLSPKHGTSSGSRTRDGLQLWRVAANTMNKQATGDK
jgi:hypothetical protein